MAYLHPMSEYLGDKRVFSLLEVATSIRRVLEQRYGNTYWIKAEMNKLNPYPYSGHCYPELVEKATGRVTAQMRSILWQEDYARINAAFLTQVGQPLGDGMKLLLCARIQFDPVYGLSLRIVDIDPSFTLGDLEREKQEALARLKREGLYDRNRGLTPPLLPQRLAVISVDTSKGYADFLRVIDDNPWGYRFFHMLFPALLQGERAVESIRGQLRRIDRVRHHFDAVAIVRGGGGDIGLSCYNDYGLAADIARFPLPVFTGIGHATNETVVEMVAFQNAITPTKVGELLIQQFHAFAMPLQRAGQLLPDRARRLTADESSRLRDMARFFRSVTRHGLIRQEEALRRQRAGLGRAQLFLRGAAARQLQQVDMLRRGSRAAGSRALQLLEGARGELRRHSDRLGQRQALVLDHLAGQVKALDPERVLKRGYSITLAGGKAVTRAADVPPGEILTTRVVEGSLRSQVLAPPKNASDA